MTTNDNANANQPAPYDWETDPEWRREAQAAADMETEGERIKAENAAAEGLPLYPEDITTAGPQGCRRVDYPDGSGAYETPPPTNYQEPKHRPSLEERIMGDSNPTDPTDRAAIALEEMLAEIALGQ